MDKVDFTAEAEPEQPFPNVKAGEKLQLCQQEDGSWCCNREDGSTLCPVPAAAAASLSQHHSVAATAVVRSVKRCQHGVEAAASIQVRISFSMAGEVGQHRTRAQAQYGWFSVWCPKSDSWQLLPRLYARFVHRIISSTLQSDCTTGSRLVCCQTSTAVLRSHQCHEIGVRV